MKTFSENFVASMTKAERELPVTMGDLLPYIGRLVSEHKALKQRVEKIENKGVKYVGVWQRSAEYERSDLASHKGSMWHAIRATRDEPGTSSAWQLAVKAGRDAK
jgi:hypothetical protein